MFRFLEISLHGWDLFPPVKIPLDRDVVLITGPNGSGKTTLLDAIRQILNASKLSSRRRLAHYMRRPGEDALVRAVVSNQAPEGSLPPFRPEGIPTPEVTLACAVLPGTGGTPEKRFAILPGRPDIDAIRDVLRGSRQWYPPERYSRALEQAGVSKSLLKVLAIEQGRTNQLFERKPRELFVEVLDMLGDRDVLLRYQKARATYDDTEREAERQTRALLGLQAELGRLERQLEELARWD